MERATQPDQIRAGEEQDGCFVVLFCFFWVVVKPHLTFTLLDLDGVAHLAEPAFNKAERAI